MVSKDVLVVEDDPEVNELVGAYVRIAGCAYRRALDGQSALSQARLCPPALIVLDVMLPDLDGFEICRQLKSNTTTATVPIVILTALDRDEDRRRGLECGADEYLTKPFNPDRLLAAIHKRTDK